MNALKTNFTETLNNGHPVITAALVPARFSYPISHGQGRNRDKGEVIEFLLQHDLIDATASSPSIKHRTSERALASYAAHLLPVEDIATVIAGAQNSDETSRLIRKAVEADKVRGILVLDEHASFGERRLSWQGGTTSIVERTERSQDAVEFVLNQIPEGTLRIAQGRYLSSNASQETARLIENGKVDLLITQAPLFRARFEEWLEGVHQSRLHHKANILIEVPHIATSAELQHWYRRIGVNATTDREARELLQRFVRAEEHGTITSFATDFNRNLTAWAYDLPLASGIHLILNGGEQQINHLSQTFKSRVENDLGHRESIHRKSWQEFVSTLHSLGIKVDRDSILESGRPTPSTKGTDRVLSYFEEISSCLPVIHEVLAHAKKRAGTNPGFARIVNSLEVDLSRIGFVIPGVPAIELISKTTSAEAHSSGPSGYIVAINLREFTKRRNGAEQLRTALNTALDRFSQGFETADEVTFLVSHGGTPAPNGESRSPLARLSNEGWPYVRRLAESESTAQGRMASSALLDGFIDRRADELVATLRVTEDIKDPIYLEPGGDGHGAQEFFERVYDLIKDDAELLAHANRLTYVVTDFSDAALSKAKKELGAQLVFGQETQRLTIKVKTLLLDQAENPAEIYRRKKFDGRVIGGASINLFCALLEDSVARQGDKVFHVKVRTALSHRRIGEFLNKKCSIIEEPGAPEKEFTFHELLRSQLFSLHNGGYAREPSPVPPYSVEQLHDVSVEDPTLFQQLVRQYLVTTVEGFQSENTASRFVEKACDDWNLDEIYGIRLWQGVFQSLEQYSSYQQIKNLSDPTEVPWVQFPNGTHSNEILEEVLGHHGPNIRVPLDSTTIHALSGITTLLHPEAKFIALQLTSDLLSLGSNYNGRRALGPVVASPVVNELVTGWLRRAGNRVEVISASEFEGRPTSRALVIQNKSGGLRH